MFSNAYTIIPSGSLFNICKLMLQTCYKRLTLGARSWNKLSESDWKKWQERRHLCPAGPQKPYHITQRGFNTENWLYKYWRAERVKKHAEALAGVVQWMSTSLWTKRLLQRLISSQGTCLGCGPCPQVGVCERQPHVDVSFSLSLLSPLSKNKQFFKKHVKFIHINKCRSWFQRWLRKHKERVGVNRT